MYKLLIADDEANVRAVLSKMIDWGDLGFSLEGTYGDGAEIIDYLQNDMPDVIFTDIRMSSVSGIDVAEYIQKHKLPSRVVLLSAYQEFEMAQRGIRYNVKDYLLKPLDLNVIENTFRHIKAELDEQNDHKKLTDRAKQIVADLLNLNIEQAREGFHQAMDDLKTANARFRSRVIYDIFTSIENEMKAGGLETLADTMSIFNFTLFLSMDRPESLREYGDRIFDGLCTGYAEQSENAKDLLARAKRYICSNLNKDINRKETADHLYISTAYLSRLFKQHTKETFAQYTTRKKIEKAMEMLQNPGMRIYEISGSLGYMTPRYFSRLFKAHTGMNPGEYRAAFCLGGNEAGVNQKNLP